MIPKTFEGFTAQSLPKGIFRLSRGILGNFKLIWGLSWGFVAPSSGNVALGKNREGEAPRQTSTRRGPAQKKDSVHWAPCWTPFLRKRKVYIERGRPKEPNPARPPKATKSSWAAQSNSWAAQSNQIQPSRPKQPNPARPPADVTFTHSQVQPTLGFLLALVETAIAKRRDGMI